MIRLRDLSIRNKLTILVMGTSAAAVFLASLALYFMVVGQYKKSYQDDLSSLARVIGHNCNVALAFNVPEDAQKVLASLSTRPSVCCAAIYDVNGNLFADYNREDRRFPNMVVRRDSALDGSIQSGDLEVKHDIMLDGQTLGSIVLEDDMGPLQNFRMLAVYSLAIAVLIALVITYLLAARLQALISRPVFSLATLARQVSDNQDYSLRAGKYGEDEVGHLVDAFNEMLSQIEMRNHKLRESERRFRNLVDQAVDAFFLHDKNGRILDVNKRACDSLGYSREELLSMSVEEIDCQAVNEAYREKIWRNMIFGSPITLEGEHCRKNGTSFPVEVKLGLLEIDGQTVYMALARDISERRQAEADKQKLETQLQQAQKMESIGTLAGGIAHDFNNILTPIFGYLELAVNELPEEGTVRRYLGEVEQAAERAKDLVRQILTFSRQGGEDRTPIQIHMIVKEALKLLRASIPTTIEIRQNIDPYCGYAMANPTQIHQVLMNLCTNAYYSMRDTGGVLGVTLAPFHVGKEDVAKNIHLTPGEYLRLAVSDTGHGMDKAILSRIFEPYFTTKLPGEGTGMGLSVVHGIVKYHGGFVTAYSESGKGSTFHVYLPVIDVLAEEKTGTDALIPRAKDGEHIMIVDDEEHVITMVEEILGELGYRVTAFSDPTTALEVFREDPDAFDLVITDMTMPKLTGYVLARELMDVRKNVPVLMCTGYSEIINEQQAKEIGIRRFIMKPFATRIMARAIREAIEEDGPSPEEA